MKKALLKLIIHDRIYGNRKYQYFTAFRYLSMQVESAEFLIFAH